MAALRVCAEPWVRAIPVTTSRRLAICKVRAVESTQMSTSRLQQTASARSREQPRKLASRSFAVQLAVIRIWGNGFESRWGYHKNLVTTGFF